MRIPLIISFLFILSILSSSNLKGQNRDSLILKNLDSIVNLGLRNNYNQAIYNKQIDLARENFKAAHSFLYPTISGSFSGQDNLNLATTIVPGELIGKPGTTFNAQFGKKYVYNSGITAQEDILSWQNLLQLKLADGNFKLSKIQQEAFGQSLKEQIIKLYYSALVAKFSLSLFYEDLKIADTLEKISELKLKEGIIDLLNLNQSKINQNLVKQNIAQSKLLYDQGIENLKIIIGEKGDREIKLSQNLNLDSILLNPSENLNPDKNLNSYKQTLDIYKTQAQLSRSALYPKLSLSSYFGAQEFRNDFGLSLNSNSWTKYSYLGLNLNIPIFTGFNTLHKYRASLAQKDLSQIQYESAKIQSKIQDELVIKTENDLLESLKSSENTFSLYKNNFGLNENKFKEGLIGLDIYLKSFQDYLNAENSHLNSISQYLTNHSTILSRQ